jgi:hypothetical protein
MVKIWIWEQEVGGSNPLAPSNNFKHLERVPVEPVFIFAVLLVDTKHIQTHNKGDPYYVSGTDIVWKGDVQCPT